jgi:hypothetical protein
VARLLQFAHVDETDVLEFFLGIGFRNGEGTHVESSDFDARNKEVTACAKVTILRAASRLEWALAAETF